MTQRAASFHLLVDRNSLCFVEVVQEVTCLELDQCFYYVIISILSIAVCLRFLLALFPLCGWSIKNNTHMDNPLK